MRKSIFATASLALMLMAGTTDASAGFFYPDGTTTQSTFSKKQKAPGEFLQKAVDANGVMTPDHVLEATHISEFAGTGSLLSPTGENWFYTIECDGDKMPGSSIYYTKWNFKTFKLTVYDGKFNIVGYIHGDIEFPENAYRCNVVFVDTQVTSTFFNVNSSDYEVIMSFNFNPDETKYYYGAKQYSQAYTLQTTMPEEPQEYLFRSPGTPTSVISDSSSTSESYVLSFTYTTTWTNESALNDKSTIYVYKPVSWGKKEPELIAKQTSSYTPGDGMNEPNPFFIVAHNGTVYSVSTYYEKPLFDYSGDEPVMTPDNHFIIELYKPTASNPIVSDDPDNKPVPYKTVSIPMDSKTSDGKYTWRSYALGNFLGESDVTWDFSDPNGDPCFIMTVLDSNVQEESACFYQVFDINGNMVKEFGTASNSYVVFPAADGMSKQIGFEVLNEDGSTVTQLVDWPSLEVKGEIPALFEYDGNIYTQSSVPSRVLGEGETLYAANAVPSMGDGESAFCYIAYFRANGDLHHMDILHLPENTAKAYAYVVPEVMDPYLFNTDSKNEYLIWLYSWKDGNKVGANLSLCVVDNEGTIIARRDLPEGHSEETAYVSNCPDKKFIVLTWRDASKRDNPDLLELIGLPLNNFEGAGTVADPYIIRTFGDFDQIRNNLTSHFALANDIDFQNRALRPVDGTFLGTIDGRNKKISNVNLTVGNSGAMFMQFGQRQEEENAELAAMKNIIFDGITISRSGTQYGTKPCALIAYDARFAEFNKVNVLNANVEISGVNTTFGAIANIADNVRFIDCAVKDANVNIERGNGVAGLVYDVRQSQISNCAVTGSFKGRMNVAGIAGAANSYSTAFENCHVNATLEATVTTLGGIVAANNSRSTVRNCIVEGSITADSSVGAIVGSLAAPEEVEAENIIEGNIVAVDEFNVGETPSQAHRIVGYTSIDDGDQYKWVPNPDYDENDPNSSAGEYKEVPAEAETKIGVNHVISGIAPVEATEGLATEGTTTDFADVDQAFLQDLGFRFGNSTDAPWLAPTWMNRIPALYFENTIGQSISFTQEAYEGKAGETINVLVEFSGIDLVEGFGSGLVELGSTDESVAYFNGYMDLVNESTVSLQVDLIANGTTELYIGSGAVRATATVTVTGGEEKPTITFIPDTYTGEVGETIKVYCDFQGVNFIELFGSGLMEMGSSNEEVANFNGWMDMETETMIYLMVDLYKEGTTELHIAAGDVRGTATVTVTESTGVANVSVSNVITYANGIVSAPEANIVIADVAGRQVAAGFGELSTAELSAGVYVVSAEFDGNVKTLKIVVR